MRLDRIYSLIYGEPWLVPATTHAAFRKMLEGYDVNAPVNPEIFGKHTGIYQRTEQAGAVNGIPATEDGLSFDEVGGVAVIQICGPIGKRLTNFEKVCYGACDVDDVRKALDEASASHDTIILSFDSPGGTVAGIPELASHINNLGKHVIAYTDSLCASAAYWLASQASYVYAAPSASVGSIGVYSYFLDESQAYADAGFKPHLFTTGKFKGMGAPGIALTKDQKAYLQERVESIFAAFKTGVKSTRKQLDEECCDGRVFDGDAALRMGLIDGFADSLADVVAAATTVPTGESK